MANYDQELDKLVRHVGSIPLEAGLSIVVNIRSYNGGPEKVAITKRGQRADKTPWEKANIGRLSPETAAALGNMLRSLDTSVNRGILRGAA